MISKSTRSELAKLHAEATPGPWHREYLELSPGGVMTLGIGSKSRPVCIVNGIVESPPGLRDVALICANRNALPQLLADSEFAEKAATFLREHGVAALESLGMHAVGDTLELRNALAELLRSLPKETPDAP